MGALRFTKRSSKAAHRSLQTRQDEARLHYIDDIAEGVIRSADRIPERARQARAYKIYKHRQ